MKNAPLPWSVAADNLFDAMSLPVLRLTPHSPVSLEEVARRVNCHDDMLAALKGARRLLSDLVLDGEGNDIFRAVTDAIAKAEGRS